MLNFDPEDPFPLLPQKSHSYAEAKAHSQKVDDWLGLQTKEVEAKLMSAPMADVEKHQQLWIGLPIQSLLTPYTELRQILSILNLKENQTVVDLGAAYGRMGFVMGRHHKGVRFIGYEAVKERVVESQRCLSHLKYFDSKMICADLSAESFLPQSAEFYFIYDFGTKQAIRKTLDDLRSLAFHKPIVVVARGRSSRDAIEKEQPWLAEINKPEHFDHYSIYRS